MLAVPEFLLDQHTKETLIHNSLVDSIYESNFTRYPITYYNIADKNISAFYDVLDMLNESKSTENKKESYPVKATAFLFTLIRDAKTLSDVAAITASINSLAIINEDYATRLLSLIRSVTYK